MLLKIHDVMLNCLTVAALLAASRTLLCEVLHRARKECVQQRLWWCVCLVELLFFHPNSHHNMKAVLPLPVCLVLTLQSSEISRLTKPTATCQAHPWPSAVRGQCSSASPTLHRPVLRGFRSQQRARVSLLKCRVAMAMCALTWKRCSRCAGERIHHGTLYTHLCLATSVLMHVASCSQPVGVKGLWSKQRNHRKANRPCMPKGTCTHTRVQRTRTTYKCTSLYMLHLCL